MSMIMSHVLGCPEGDLGEPQGQLKGLRECESKPCRDVTAQGWDPME